ncbi:MAG: cobalt-precorrin 5A hydrolase [Clostridiales bacterium]|jgi:cobalt-precorrin 5A hydrolase|nr:cobalt-precorrin 5A hydrolase [Eubacteriales bacterium]MDH7565729.1 cobalt-precorrin 5A hydrolase [Clostridiales bacterium]
MKTAVVALTRNGSELAVKIGPPMGADVYLKREFIGPECGSRPEIKAIEGSFMELAGRLFAGYDALVCIMACGIAVRAIAPHISDKRTDPAVVVLDEKGRYAVSLLSGHVGGANDLAEEIAARIGGTAVITTSTDVNHVVAFDVFAKRNGCVIENFKDLKYVSSELVNGSKVGFYTDYEISGVLPGSIVLREEGTSQGLRAAAVLSNRTGIEATEEKVLYIRPRNLILGIGCKRGTPKEQIESAVDDFMRLNGRSLLSVRCLATIDLKKDEEGLLEYCRDRKLDLCIIERGRVEAVEGGFTCSPFVKEKTGVGSVAEPCAVMAGSRAKLICGKTAYRGITLALAEEEKEFKL